MNRIRNSMGFFVFVMAGTVLEGHSQTFPCFKPVIQKKKKISVMRERGAHFFFCEMKYLFLYRKRKNIPEKH